MCCLWLFLCLSAELGSCDRSSVVWKAFNIYYRLGLYKNVCPPLPFRIDSCIVSILILLPWIFNTLPMSWVDFFSCYLSSRRKIYLNGMFANKQDVGMSLDCFSWPLAFWLSPFLGLQTCDCTFHCLISRSGCYSCNLALVSKRGFSISTHSLFFWEKSLIKSLVFLLLLKDNVVEFFETWILEPDHLVKIAGIPLNITVSLGKLFFFVPISYHL